MKKAVRTLMAASSIIDIPTNDQSICTMLKKFSVSTERQKNGVRGAPDPALVGPITNLPSDRFVSAGKMAIKK